MKKSQKSDPPPFPRCARSHKQKPQLIQEGGFLQTKKDKGRQQVKQASLPNKRSISPARSPSSVEVPFCSFSKFCLSPRGGVKANFFVAAGEEEREDEEEERRLVFSSVCPFDPPSVDTRGWTEAAG